MNYFVSRGGQQYGPYAAPDLQRYLVEGSIQYSDLARTEAMAEWLPLSQLLAPGQTLPVPPGTGPIPPSLHWVLVFVLGMITGLFYYVWMFIQAAFVRKIDPQSKAMLLYVLGVLAIIGGVVVAVVFAFAMTAGSEGRDPTGPAIGMGLLMAVVMMAGSSLMVAGAFSIRSSMLRYYNSVEPIQLRLSAVMTLFFNTLYIQYHLTRIAKWKQTGILSPQ
ncbi:MAG: DUF4339 domain-containing protein [Acidobacteriota bacterium]|nr:DUF4339 domain-containing protein [Acidobacteriota bacterium]